MKVAALDDKNVQSFLQVGETNMLLQHYRQAIDAYRRGLEIDPNHMACAYNLGFAYYKLDDPRSKEYFSKAVDIFEQAKASPEKTYMANVYEAMSRAYITLGDVKKGIQLLEDALAVARELPKGRFFSSSRYQYMSQNKFIADVEARLQSAGQKLAKANPIAGGESQDHKVE